MLLSGSHNFNHTVKNTVKEKKQQPNQLGRNPDCLALPGSSHSLFADGVDKGDQTKEPATAKT